MGQVEPLVSKLLGAILFVATACEVHSVAADPLSKLETRNWKLETGNSKFKPRNSITAKLETNFAGPKSKIQNLKSVGVGPGRQPPSLIAHPLLTYSSYLGGSGFDIATGLAVDSEGNLYVTGYTNSPDFPTLNAAQPALGGGACGSGLDSYACFDGYLAKFDASGHELIYATYFGGSGEDYSTAIAVDAAGNAYISGYTNSTDLPTYNAFQSQPSGGTCGTAPSTSPCFDAFVAKLDASGSIVYATYLGGGADDFAQGIAVDTEGKAVVAGTTASTDFPMRHAVRPEFSSGASDGFVAKLDASGSRLAFSTYLGGSGDDFATGLALDPSGGISVTGYSNSPDLPVANALQPAYAGGTCGALANTFPCFDGFVSRLAADGTRFEYLTYLGGTGGDYANAITVDDAGSAYVTGMTTSQDWPVTFHAFQTSGGGTNTDAFVAKLDPSGASLVYSTYLGGTGAESGNAIAVDDSGRAFIAGYAYGAGFPLVNPTQPANAGFYDAFLAVLNEDGTAIEFSTCFGGAINERARALAFDPYGNALMAGETFSTDLPTTPQAFQPAYMGGSFDAFVARITTGDAPSPLLSSSSLAFGHQLVGTESSPQDLTLSNIGSATLELSGISVQGDFTATHNCQGSLGPGASCSIQLTFAPVSIGDRSGTLVIANRLPEETRTAALLGTGTDFALTSTPAADSVNAGETATFTLTANPAGGFDESIALTCAGAPAAATCSVSPAAVVLDGQNPATATVKVSTKARALATPPTQFPALHPLVYSLLMMLAVLAARKSGRVEGRLCAAGPRFGFACALLMFLSVFWTACGGGGGGGGGSPPPLPEGTPAGTYTLTVTGSFDGVARSTTVKLTVK
jgi:hypothetical protein